MYLQPQPKGFIPTEYKFTITLDSNPSIVQQWLNDPKTFTKSQVWPYRVEFYTDDPNISDPGFQEGTYNVHHGPFINFAGRLISISNGYRDLQYFYGSYAISMRLVRPYRLEFWTKEKEGATALTCKVSYWVKPWFEKIWIFLQKGFWITFPSFTRRGISNHQQ